MRRICPRDHEHSFECEGNCKDESRINERSFCFCPTCLLKHKNPESLGRPLSCDALPIEFVLKSMVRDGKQNRNRTLEKDASQ